MNDSYIMIGETYVNRADRKYMLEKVCVFVVAFAAITLFVL